MIAIKPSERVYLNENVFVFLAGSIEMGKAEDWQTILTSRLTDCGEMVVLNPRRDDWDSSWKQELGDNQFTEQVKWELNGLGMADIIVYYFDPSTISPITLLELGFIGGMAPDKMIVCCPEGFHRKGNVDVFCKYNHIKQVSNLDELAKEVIKEYVYIQRTK